MESVAITVGTSATRLDDSSRRSCIVANVGAVTVYLGDEGVSLAQGFPLEPGATLSFALTGRDWLYGIAASSCEVRVLSTKARP